MAVPDLMADEIPRERFREHGGETLTDEEVLALLLGGTPAGALKRAEGLLGAAGGLAGLRSARPEELQALGATPATAARLSAALELGIRLSKAKLLEKPPLAALPELARYLSLRYRRADQEVMGALYLSRENRIIREEEVFRGTLARAAVEPRPILKQALLFSADSVLLFHTHPSGLPEPSTEDIHFTRRMAKAGEVLGIPLADHIIVGENSFVSMRQRGW